MIKKISVILSTYNNAPYLERAVRSVLGQSYSDFEFIIINDNSQDNTEEILQTCDDKRIVYIKNENTKGLIHNLNKGIDIATGEYIARIDGDDWWLDSDKLKKQVEFLDAHRDYALVGTWAKVYDQHVKELYQIKYATEWEDIRKKLLLKNFFVHSSVMFRKKIAEQCGRYHENEKFVEDYGLWLRMGLENKLGNIGECCVAYLHNEEGETQKNNLRQIKANIKLVGEFRKKYPFYHLALLRWCMKYVVVLLGGLGYINNRKRR